MKVAEEHITLSWIWKVVGVTADSDNAGLQEGKCLLLVNKINQAY